MGDPSNSGPGAGPETSANDDLPDLPLNLNWKLIIVAIVAFVLGVGAGGFAEHEHTKSSHKHSAASSTPTTSGPGSGSKTPVDTAGWFGSKVTTACPALRIWNGEEITRRAAFAKSTTWKTKRATALRVDGPITAAYKAMLPLATTTGKPEIQLLLTAQGQLDAALPKAATAADYTKTRLKVMTTQVTNDQATLRKIAVTCPT